MDWITKSLKIRKNRVVVKQYNKENLIRSIFYPSDKYPLGEGEIHVFHKNICEKITDEIILECFDKIDYKIGHCYQNSKKLYEELKRNGIDARTYVGWLYTSDLELPVHHCWVVINNSVLDLADDYTMLVYNQANFKECKNKKDSIEVLADFYKFVKENNIKNSNRCTVVGQPSSDFLYIGTEMDADEGRKMYQELIKRYPNHEIENNINTNGLNKTQEYILKYHG